MSADATPPPPPPPGAAAHGATFQTGIDSLLELVAARSRGEVSSSAVEEAVSRLLREGGEGEGGDARPAAAAAPPHQLQQMCCSRIAAAEPEKCCDPSADPAEESQPFSRGASPRKGLRSLRRPTHSTDALGKTPNPICIKFNAYKIGVLLLTAARSKTPDFLC